jgi:predicted metal-binding membrane protein
VSLESILKRDRWIVAGGLAFVVAIGWIYLLSGAGMGHGGADATAGVMREDADMTPGAWTLRYAVVMFFMWWIMMAAMMLPSAAPILLLVAALNRKSEPQRRPYGPTGLFAAGYLIAWAGFSVVAVGVQWWLTQNGVVSATLQATSRTLAGGLLIAAGLWQLTPVKRACLRHCRSPMWFLTQRRRSGKYGGAVMGLEHGVYCLGCCWLLMALLFVGGVMNLYWVVGLAVYVLGEKLLPAGQGLRRLAAAALLLWGIALAGGLL